MSLIFNTSAGEEHGGSFYNGVATTSLRLDDGSAAHLHRTPAADSSDAARKKYTFSTWIKRASLGTTQQILAIGSGAGGAPWFFLYFLTSDQIQAYWYSTTSGNATNSAPTFAPVLRDTSAWYNIVLVVDTTDGTATDRFKLYINGVRAAVATAGNALLQNYIGVINSNIKHYIGSNANTEQYLDAYLADTNMIDGTAIGETSGYLDEFGELKNGVWIPKDTSELTFGANGFRLKYTSTAHDAPASEGDADTDNIGADSSGENNHWTALDAIVASDCAMPDSPELNFSTLNPLAPVIANTPTYSEGNLKLTGTSYGNWRTALTTFKVTEGKWYFEFKIIGGTYHIIGVTSVESDGLATAATQYLGKTATGYGYQSADGKVTTNSSDIYAGSTYSSSHVVGVALDLDNNKLYFARDNTWQNSGDPTSGSTGTGAVSITDADGYIVAYSVYQAAAVGVLNFGADASFAGGLTGTDVGDETDGEGFGLFKYAPPSGFLALCTANLPEPTIGPNSLTQSKDHFGILKYTGNGAQTRTITSGASGIGGQADFKPDWVVHRIVTNTGQSAGNWDSTRGFTAATTLDWAENTAEGTWMGADPASYGFVSAVDTDTDGNAEVSLNDGTATNGGYVNYNSRTYLLWNWKANGGTATATISESGDNPAAVVQANPTAGFSLITYTGTGDAGTIAHGLNAVPTMILIKNRDAADSWAVYHAKTTGPTTSATHYLVLDTSAAKADNASHWADTATTDSVFTVHDAHNVNADGEKYVAYVFADVEGYSKMGGYSNGTGTADGAFVYLGFKPAWIMIKASSNGENWLIHNNVDDPINPGFTNVHGDTSAAANTNAAYQNIDMLSNGFKARVGGAQENGSGWDYIYMAFAEQPFKYANAK
mgnify:CR=1 FL=1